MVLEVVARAEFLNSSPWELSQIILDKKHCAKVFLDG